MREVIDGWKQYNEMQSHGIFEKNKARLVTRSNHHYPSIAYNKTLLPVMFKSLHALLAIAPIRDPDVLQFDIKSSGLQCPLQKGDLSRAARWLLLTREEKLGVARHCGLV